jgi:hypothetical protein
MNLAVDTTFSNLRISYVESFIRLGRFAVGIRSSSVIGPCAKGRAELPQGTKQAVAGLRTAHRKLFANKHRSCRVFSFSAIGRGSESVGPPPVVTAVLSEVKVEVGSEVMKCFLGYDAV